MTRPIRIQRKRTKSWTMPPNTVYVGRPTRWGNPTNATQRHIVFGHFGYPMPAVTLQESPSLGRSLDMYVAVLRERINQDPTHLDPLLGKNLCCWCPLDQPCHADILLRLIGDGTWPPLAEQPRLLSSVK